MVAIGIDLGTTYSCVGWWKDNRCEIIANDQGNRTTPSYVAFTKDERIIGDGAKNQSSMNPENTIFDAKRLIGRDYNDSTLQGDLKHLPFDVKDDNAKRNLQIVNNKLRNRSSDKLGDQSWQSLLLEIHFVNYRFVIIHSVTS